MATVRFALFGVCYISEEHARLSGPPHQRDTLAKKRFLVSCACVRWACCGRNAVVPKSPGREEGDQEGGMHPSPVWVSALFWWWWSFPGNWCWLMVAPHYTWLVIIDAGQVDIWKSVVQFSSFLLKYLITTTSRGYDIFRALDEYWYQCCNISRIWLMSLEKFRMPA